MYYAARAPEYDRVYSKPERQSDIYELQSWLPRQFEGRRVLDVACGTGFWTQFIAPVTCELVGVDAAASTLDIARARISQSGVTFVVGDAYDLSDELGQFDAAFVGFWFSHVPRCRRREFLEGVARRLDQGANVVMLDNLYVEGSNHPVTEQDDDGNTYQVRSLDDGSRHVVLKNFPTEGELVDAVSGLADKTTYRASEYYWVFHYCAVRA